MHRHSSHKAASLSPARISSTHRRGLVLCIDDEACGLRSRQLILEKAGYEVTTCLDGKKGMKVFSAMPVNIVVLDYAMPGLDGVEIARQMRQIKPDVPIIMFSGYPDPPVDSAAVVDVYIVKGTGPDFLLQTIKQLLERSKRISAA